MENINVPSQLPEKPKKVYILAVPKGGVAKTMTAKNLAAAFSLLGYKVLLIDLDPQANATEQLFGEDSVPHEKTIYGLLDPTPREKDAPPLDWKDFVKTYKKGSVEFDVLPSGNNVSLLEFSLQNASGGEFYFRNRILSKITGYDIVLVDCQPSLGILVVNALCSSPDNYLLVCGRPDAGSRSSMGFLFNTVSSLEENLQVMPKDFKVLITQVDKRHKTDEFNLQHFEVSYPNHILKTKIHKNVSLAAATDAKSDIFNFDPKSTGAIEYMECAKELLGDK